AAVDIEGLPQILRAHCRALDVPARSARSPRTVPTWFSRLTRFPQRKIQRRSLALVDFYPGTRFQLVDFFAREFPIASKAFYRIQSIPIDLVSQTLLFQSVDQ